MISAVEIAIASSSGTIGSSYGYDPYGNTTATGGSVAQEFQFTGRENDSTGLFYYRARYYNPAWGRFVSEDPIGVEGGINKYAYASNDPLNRNDPTGQFGIPGAIIGAFFGGLTGAVEGLGSASIQGGITGQQSAVGYAEAIATGFISGAAAGAAAGFVAPPVTEATAGANAGGGLAATALAALAGLGLGAIDSAMAAPTGNAGCGQ